MSFSLRCLRAGGRIAGRSAGAGDGERLRIEDHLQHCVRCTDDARRLDLARAAIHEAPMGSTHGRSRAIASALRAIGTQQQTRRSRQVWFARTAVAAAIAILAVLSGVERDHSELRALAPVAVPEAQPREVIASVQTSYTLEHARVIVEAGGRFTWHPSTSRFALHAGTATFDVDRGHGAFRVIAPAFVVEVLGTRFTVDDASVRVEEGVVRVLAHDGSVLADAIRAGERWPVEAKPAPVPARPGPKLTFEARIAHARATLARKDVSAARRELSAIIAARPPAKHAAAARNLLAECALVDGDLDGAVTLYLDVASRYPDLAAGENALFAAARLEHRRKRAPAAIELLRKYLARYPNGRFHAEATDHLNTLEEKP